MEIKELYTNKLEGIVDQFRQSREEGRYFGHYLTNVLCIALGYEKGFVDYKCISHENQIMSHGSNRIVAALFGEL